MLKNHIIMQLGLFCFSKLCLNFMRYMKINNFLFFILPMRKAGKQTFEFHLIVPNRLKKKVTEHEVKEGHTEVQTLWCFFSLQGLRTLLYLHTS